MIWPVIGRLVLAAAIKLATDYGKKKIKEKVLKELVKKAREHAKKAFKKELKRRQSCKTCPPLSQEADPCSFLAGGNPNGAGKYRGGSYKGVKVSGMHSHHTPAKAAYPPGSMDKDLMPSISMEPGDHTKTMSYGGGPTSIRGAYRSAQKQAMKRGDVLGAFAMDVVDIKIAHPKKYDTALMEAGAYAACITKFKDKYPVGKKSKNKGKK